MNKIEATAKKIESCDAIHIVTFDCGNEEFTMMALELPVRVKEGVRVVLGIKPSFVLIAKSKSRDISLTNQINATITYMDVGKLLVTVKLKSSVGIFESLITKKSYDMMGLSEGQNVVVMMKASEISIVGISDGV
ncbi:MAG: TOBE domain-containing protein [Campylobacteraceae bacterium]|nr:TOBE domain-containing protein [Campylobacteraceae bacterium]